MTMAMTLAKMGRSMKNLEIMGRPFWRLRLGPGEFWRLQLRVEPALFSGVTCRPGMARNRPLTTTHSSPLQTFQDDAVFVHLDAEFDLAALHDILVVHQPDKGAHLVIADGHLRHQQGLLFLVQRRFHPGEHARQDDGLRIGDDGPQHAGCRWWD